MNPDGAHVRQGPVHRKMLTLKTMHRPTLPRSGHWWDTGQFREDDRMPESLEAQLRATLNIIPAHTWYAARSGGLTRRQG